MALYDNTSFLTCDSCGCYELEIKRRGNVVKESTIEGAQIFNTYTRNVLVCTECNKVLEIFSEYDNKILLERGSYNA